MRSPLDVREKIMALYIDHQALTRAMRNYYGETFLNAEMDLLIITEKVDLLKWVLEDEE